MNFGQALELLKDDKMVARKGWNGKNMHIYLERDFAYVIPAGHFVGQEKKDDPVICMYTAQGTHQPGWLASQADILAEDWEVVWPVVGGGSE